MIRCKFFLILVLSSLITELTAQQKNIPFKFETAITNDFNFNVLGGKKQGFSFLGNIDLVIIFDTEKGKLWKGGSFFVYGLANYGNSLSALVGDIQISNNIEADTNVRLYQFWYKHKFKNFELTIGQHDLNSEFAIPEFGLSFLHSSFGIQPDISVNVPASIFPVATIGAIAKWESSKLSVLAAVYNGNPGSEITNPNSLNLKINKTNGIMNVAEFQYRNIKDSIIQSTYKIGFWNHTANTFSLKNQKIYRNNQGFYFISDYKLFRENNNPTNGLNAFMQIGIAPKSSNLINYYSGMGMTYQGLFHQREDDELAIAFGYASLNDDFSNNLDRSNNESIIELTYNARINSNLIIQPDFQYIMNPGGFASIKDAFIFSIRTKIEF